MLCTSQQKTTYYPPRTRCAWKFRDIKQLDIVKVANNVTMRFSMQIKAPLWGFWQEMSFIYLWKMDHGPIWILFLGIDLLFFLPTTPKILDYLKKCLIFHQFSYLCKYILVCKVCIWSERLTFEYSGQDRWNPWAKQV